MTSKTKYVYDFLELKEVIALVGDTQDALKGLLGGKGAGLSQMSALGLPVPPGFTITTDACKAYLKSGKWPDTLWDEIKAALHVTEGRSGKKLGDAKEPLFVSCRSGAKFSMPGMMDTVLNIGLNDTTSKSLAAKTTERFVQDAYRRLIAGFGSIVMGIPAEKFEDRLKEYKTEHKYGNDTEMKAEDWAHLVKDFKKIFHDETKQEFPQDAHEQLRLSISAVFSSWNSKRAIAYRKVTNIPDDLGTACNIVAMVFGNKGDTSATGVAFTRNPSTGEKKFFGEFLTNAQGEDVVAGIRKGSNVNTMGDVLPQAYEQLCQVAQTLERHYKNMQDIEFTIEEGKLYMLQCRDGKRTARAQVKIGVDMVDEKLITKEEAVKRVSPDDVNVLLLPQLDPEALEKAKKAGHFLGKGVNASPGGAVGQAVFDADEAVARKKQNIPCILIRPFTKPEDVHGFFASKGVITGEGGATSHAAVVARQFGLPCIAGVTTFVIDLKKKQFTAHVDGKDVVVKDGEWISLDATAGNVYAGKLPTVAADFSKEKELQRILAWSDEICASCKRPSGLPGLQVWTNADYGKDAKRAREFGAMGIGLCRTEHMFFEKERIPIVQAMIMAKTTEEKQKYLDELLPCQRKDFYELFEAMSGLPVIVRFLDPPLHEFLPTRDEVREKVEMLEHKNLTDSEEYKKAKVMLATIDDLHESNPMIGLRGCRVSVMYPQITRMQARALLEAACDAKAKGFDPHAEIMIPLVSHVNELNTLKPIIEETAKAVFAEKKMKVDFLYGTMVETPRAALTAGEVAKTAEFFSFGTNDLTQMTFGIARDDAERKFLVQYVERGIMPSNPFQTLDQDGVGQLIKWAVKNGRATRAGIDANHIMSIGICGEVGGDPTTIGFCHNNELSYVSCSPFRVPVARLAAAHAVLKAPKA